jgi:hypothetical protein
VKNDTELKLRKSSEIETEIYQVTNARNKFGYYGWTGPSHRQNNVSIKQVLLYILKVVMPLELELAPYVSRESETRFP